MKMTRTLLVAASLAFSTGAARANVTVGINVSVTGPAAVLGLIQRNTFALMPETIAGEKVDYIILDDASDPSTAVSNLRRMISEDKIDVVLGSTISPSSLAMIDLVAEAAVPMISMAGASSIVEPVDDKRRWVFKTPQSGAQMSTAIVEHMIDSGVKTVAFIGFADAYGEGWWQQFSAIAEARRLRLIASERYNLGDASVAGQVLRIVSAHPDAVLVAGSGTPAVLPETALRARGFAGKIYQTQGAANKDFLRVCGKDCEGTLLPAGPVLVAAQLPDGNPVRKAAINYITRYEAAYGKGSASPFGAYAWDAGLLLRAAVPVALTKARPGTAAFRAALRDALEASKEVVGTHGIFNMSPADHLGLDQRSRVMVEVRDGDWKLVR